MRRFFVLLVCLNLSISLKYDAKLAANLYQLASAAYGDTIEQCINNTFLNSGNFKVLLKVVKECQHATCAFFALRAAEEKTTVFAFSGTKGPLQLIKEGYAVFFEDKVDFHGLGNSNSYFTDEVEFMWEHVVKVLNDPLIEDDHLILTGHSLGGTQAALTALKIVHYKYRPSQQVTVYTFGEPRIGDYHLAEEYNKLVPNTFRVVNRYDGVAASATNGYAHHGTKILYPNGMDEDLNDYIVCDKQLVDDSEECDIGIGLRIWKTHQKLTDHIYYFGVMTYSHGRNGCFGPHILNVGLGTNTTDSEAGVNYSLLGILAIPFYQFAGNCHSCC